jgi:hypothetical protein
LSRIEWKAFRDCAPISILIPAKVEVISENSFFECEFLESVVIELRSRLERIEQYAFAATAVKEPIIPSAVVFLSGAAFVADTLTSISFSALSPKFCLDGGMIRDISRRHLIRSFEGLPGFGVLNSVELNCESSFAVHFKRFHLN